MFSCGYAQWWANVFRNNDDLYEKTCEIAKYILFSSGIVVSLHFIVRYFYKFIEIYWLLQLF